MFTIFATKIMRNMPEPIELQILGKVKKARRGTLFFIDNFISVANAKSVGKALERLVKSGKLQRVAAGIYVRPEVDPVIGYVTPGIETIAMTIAKRVGHGLFQPAYMLLIN